MIILLIILMLCSGILGRMGGAVGYHTLYRDWGCSFIMLIVTGLLIGWKVDFWWVYTLVFLFHYGAFSTYWDSFFGYDCMWFSGVMVGLALCPVLLVDKSLISLIIIRMFLLGVSWEYLNRVVSKWKDGDIIEENLRYTISM